MQEEKVKFLDIGAINSRDEAQLQDAANRVIKSGWYLNGKENELFGKEFSEIIGTNYCVPLGNGLEALEITIRAYKELGLFKDNDEILVPANTYIATILAISENGLVPVLIEPGEDHLIDVNRLENEINDKTVCILPVHLYGKTCDMKTINDIAYRYDLIVIEDCAQSHYSKDDQGNVSGSTSDVGCFSFYPGKNLGALGDSGCICTDDSQVAQMVKTICNYGSKKKYYNEVKGVNSRMDEIQAAFLRVKLTRLRSDTALRQKVAQFYMNNIENVDCLPKIGTLSQHAFHLFVLTIQNREAFIEFLAAKGIETLIHYPVAPFNQQCYKDEFFPKDFPITAEIHDKIISIPLSPVITLKEQQRVVDAINSYFKESL